MVGRTRRGIGPTAEAGFTLLEVVLGLTTLMITVAVIGLGLQTGVSVSREIRDLEIIHAQAQAYMDCMLSQSFGSPSDNDPSGAMVDEIFDGDAETGDVTLHQLSRYPAGDQGWVFSLADFPVTGFWRVQVDQDLDDDGVVSGALESSQDILRLRVFFNELLILATEKATEATN